jgi:hypothetical protein
MRSAWAVALAGLFAACASTPEHDSGPGATYWPPLAPATLGAERAANQRLRAAFGDQEVSLDCVVKVSAGHLTVIGLVPGGPRMFSVDYDGEHVAAQESAEIPEDLRPQLLLNDLQLTLWPLPALQSALDHSRWTVTEPDARTRRLARDRKLIAEVHYASADPWTGRAWLVNFERGYSITIDSLPLE